MKPSPYILTALTAIAISALAFSNIGCRKKSDVNVRDDIDIVESKTIDFDLGGGIAGGADVTDPAKTMVSVNGNKLTYGEVDKMVRQMLQTQGAPADQIDMIQAQMGPAMRQRMAEQFVVMTLLKDAAKSDGFEVSDAEVDAKIDEITASQPPGFNLTEAIAEMGISMEKLRGDIEDQERIRKLYDAQTAAVNEATDEEVADYYAANSEQFAGEEEVTARHILVTSTEEDDAETRASAKAKIDGLRAQLLEGADFAELAAANSDCPSKADGGNLGSFGRGRMVPSFEEAAFSLDPNAISEVVESPFGYHIIQVTERKEAGAASLDSVKDSLKEDLTAQKRNDVFDSYIEGLRANAEIIYDDSEEQTQDLEAILNQAFSEAAGEVEDAAEGK